MPTLISIAVESPKHYMAIDSESRVWRGQAAGKRGASIVIKWESVKSEFLDSGEPARLTGGGLPQQDAVEDELEP
jgi:hypothetical protein